MGLSHLILKLLREETDEMHRLRQIDIVERLKGKGIPVTRKTVHRKLEDLQQLGYPVVERNGWYYEHEFCSAELDLIVNSLVFNGGLPYRQCQLLIGKVAALGGGWYSPAYSQGSMRPGNPQFFYTLETLLDACERRLKVTFHYSRYDVDKRLHPRLDETGEPYVYLVNPYRVVFNNGRHYLIGNVDKYSEAAHFRIDRIEDVHIMRDSCKPMRKVRGLENGLDLQTYLTEHVYMFPGSPSPVRIRAHRRLAGDILDWFGMEVRFENVTEDTLEAVFRCDEASLKCWLARYGEDVERL